MPISEVDLPCHIASSTSTTSSTRPIAYGGKVSQHHHLRGGTSLPPIIQSHGLQRAGQLQIDRIMHMMLIVLSLRYPHYRPGLASIRPPSATKPCQAPQDIYEAIDFPTCC